MKCHISHVLEIVCCVIHCLYFIRPGYKLLVCVGNLLPVTEPENHFLLLDSYQMRLSAAQKQTQFQPSCCCGNKVYSHWMPPQCTHTTVLIERSPLLEDTCVLVLLVYSRSLKILVLKALETSQLSCTLYLVNTPRSIYMQHLWPQIKNVCGTEDFSS